jgi:hypothetical protein
MLGQFLIQLFPHCPGLGRDGHRLRVDADDAIHVVKVHHQALFDRHRAAIAR